MVALDKILLTLASKSRLQIVGTIINVGISFVLYDHYIKKLYILFLSIALPYTLLQQSFLSFVLTCRIYLGLLHKKA